MDAVGNLKRPLRADVMRRHTCEITGLHGHFNCQVVSQQVTLLRFTMIFFLNTASRTSCGRVLKETVHPHYFQCNSPKQKHEK